jgi:hypothetical protein
VFPLPKELTREERAAIRRAAQLVAGERVPVASGPASVTIVLKDPQFYEKLVVDDTPVSFTVTEDNYMETIAGVEVPLGAALVTIASATVTNREQLLATRPLARQPAAADDPPAHSRCAVRDPAHPQRQRRCRLAALVEARLLAYRE